LYLFYFIVYSEYKLIENIYNILYNIHYLQRLKLSTTIIHIFIFKHDIFNTIK